MVKLRQLETAVTERDPTCVGRVRHVLGSTVTVALDPELAGTAPIYRGRLQHVGQIGSLVRIPQGLVDLIATVDLVGIAELSGPIKPVELVQRDERWLQVQLLGEIHRATGRFQRGVGSYPGLDDPVHFTTPEQLASVFPAADDKNLRLGRLAAAEEIPVCVDASRFVVRHAAIVGSTGSGKTSTVASLLQGFVNGGWEAANIVVIDPHGEYAQALAAMRPSRVFLPQVMINYVFRFGRFQQSISCGFLPGQRVALLFLIVLLNLQQRVVVSLLRLLNG